MFFKIIGYIVGMYDLIFAGLIVATFVFGGINLLTFFIVLWIFIEWCRTPITLG